MKGCTRVSHVGTGWQERTGPVRKGTGWQEHIGPVRKGTRRLLRPILDWHGLWIQRAIEPSYI